MDQIDARQMDSRVLPKDTQYYIISKDGTVEESGVPFAEAYIDEKDVGYFLDRDVMRHIRTVYGPRIGVMRELKVHVQGPREFKTPKMLLGIVKPNA